MLKWALFHLFIGKRFLNIFFHELKVKWNHIFEKIYYFNMMQRSNIATSKYLHQVWKKKRAYFYELLVLQTFAQKKAGHEGSWTQKSLSYLAFPFSPMHRN